MTTTSRLPNYSLIKELAEKVLLSIKEPVLPIKLKPLINELTNKDLVVHTFSQYTEIENRDYNEFIKEAPSKDGTLRYLPDDNYYVLLYNKNIQRDRKTWTLAHELGHYYAKHHLELLAYQKANEAKEIPPELNRVFEKEANFFAKEILAPPALILMVLVSLRTTDFVSIYTVLRSLFRLSREASYYIAKDITKFKYLQFSPQLYLKYKSTLDHSLKIFLGYNTFYALFKKYRHEIDFRDQRQRMIINRIDF